MNGQDRINDAFSGLVALMARLRGPDGCPWDRQQTPETLKPYLVEECYEVLEALEEGVPGKVRDELGDLLFQIVFHARIAEEQGRFTIAEVIDAIREKMVRRHPHVFGNATAATAEEVAGNWEQIKRREKGHEDRRSVLEGVPRRLPALIRAHRLQEKASKAGFDWKHLNEVLPKLDEELAEFKESLHTGDAERIEEELGDLFFTLVNVSRFLGVNPDDALHKTIAKFIRRFRFIEEAAAAAGRPLDDMSLEEMDRLWEKSKDSGG